jgi:hypothetical protein
VHSRPIVYESPLSLTLSPREAELSVPELVPLKT